MAPERRPRPSASLAVTPDQPLIGIMVVEDGQQIVHYFADEDEIEAALPTPTIDDVRSLAGVWSDLDWEEALDELDRIRHESKPATTCERSVPLVVGASADGDDTRRSDLVAPPSNRPTR